MEHEMTPQEIREDQADSAMMDPDSWIIYKKAGLCDVCELHYGCTWVTVAGIETWVCGICHGGV